MLLFRGNEDGDIFDQKGAVVGKICKVQPVAYTTKASLEFLGADTGFAGSSVPAWGKESVPLFSDTPEKLADIAVKSEGRVTFVKLLPTVTESTEYND